MLFVATIITLRCTRPFETVEMVAREVSLTRLILSTCGQKVKKKGVPRSEPDTTLKDYFVFFDRRCDWNIHALMNDLQAVPVEIPICRKERFTCFLKVCRSRCLPLE